MLAIATVVSSWTDSNHPRVHQLSKTVREMAGVLKGLKETSKGPLI